MHEAWPVLELLYLTGRTVWPGEDSQPEPTRAEFEAQMKLMNIPTREEWEKEHG